MEMVVKPAKVKEPVPETHPNQSPTLQEPQQPQTQNNTTLNNGTSTPVTPLSPTTLSTAELDTDLESIKSKVKTKTSKAQIKLNELAQQPEFLSNETFKLQTFKFLPKSISLCNDDSVFKDNYTKFCDRNAIPHLQESEPSATSAEEVTSSSTTTTTEVSEGTKVIVTKTTKTTKTGPDGTKTVTVRKTIVKQKKTTEEDSDKGKLKTQDSLSKQDQPQPAATVKRTKFRVNQMSSRDVPVAINNVAKRYLEQNRLISTESATVPKDDGIVKKIHHKTSLSHFQQQTTSQTETANNLKNSMKTRSISVDWDAVNAVENRSMKTINSFLRRTSASSASSAVKQIQAQIEASIHK